MRSLPTAVLLSLLLVPAAAAQSPGNRLAYLDELNPYYPSRTFPKLVTPQWVGEDGVEAVVILAIDDMRDPKRYEVFLRPILRRLQKIDGRAPLSIMTNSVDPKDPQLQTWLKEGLSLETHTLDHPCPFFRGGFAKAKATYDGCVDLLAAVPNSKPVAFRMPCCDSLNTPSPRFWAEIFNKTTAKGNFLSIDSSVFNVFTANDPALPRELVLNADGSERFRRYLPADRSFVNTIEDYPYPYVIGRQCWEFPCVTPSDWQAQHVQKPNNPQTVRDWKAALDCTVVKQGVFCLVFHPHGWIKNDQVVELIDYTVAKHGKKVKFLNFREALERLNKNLLAGETLRRPKSGGENGVRVLDLNNGGYLDVLIGNGRKRTTRLWDGKKREWTEHESSMYISILEDNTDEGVRFGILHPDGRPSAICFNGFFKMARHFDGTRWVTDKALLTDLDRLQVLTLGVVFRDIDGDGCCELFLDNRNFYEKWKAKPRIFKWDRRKETWSQLPFSLPGNAALLDQRWTTGARFLDLDGDGNADIVFSDEKEYGIYLFKDMNTGWSRKVMAGKRADPNALPMISRKGTDNGFWVHSGHLWWSNEDTPLLKDHVERRNIKELLKDQQPGPLSPEASLRALKPRPGFTAELVAAEPLVQDPIAFAWGADGKLWVVEMGDYPLGIDGKGKPGGHVKFLEDTKGTGKYDKATVFLDNLAFPTGVMPWGKGVLVTCAPDIFYAEDTDGDGKADKKVVLYTGFNEGNQQHRVNSLVYGLDGWIYCANGDSGGRVKSLKTGKVVNISGRDFRIKPDTGEIELVSGGTQYGRSRDDWGNWFGGNNSNPMWHFVLDDHYLRRNPHLAPPDPRVPVSVTPGVAPVYPISRTLPRFNDPFAYNRFTSACSPIVYRDDLFGPAFAGNSFVSEPVHNLVHREIMTPKGVTFTSKRAADEQTSEFLASADNWFRPTMIQTGPDGALWVADMYRHVIEHPQWIPKDWQKKLDLRAGHDKGRIYRVYPVGKKPRAIPRLDKMTTAELVAALDSPSGWQRDTAQRLLIEKQDKSVVPLLGRLAEQCPRPLGRLHAMCTLDGLGALHAGKLRGGMADRHAGVRRHAVRLYEKLVKQRPELGIALAGLVEDPDPQVRMQLACTLGAWDSELAGNVLGRLALKDGGDPYLLAAILSSANKDNFASILGAALAGDRPVAPAVLAQLIRLAGGLGSHKTTAILLTAAATPGPGGKYTPGQMQTLASYLDSLDQRRLSLAQAGIASLEVSKAMNKVARVFAFARSTAADPAAGREERLAALRLLGRGFDKREEDRKQLATLLTPQNSEELQAGAAAALGNLRADDVPALLLRGWKRYPPGLRAQTLDALLARPESVKAVLDAVAKKQILPFDIDAARRQRLLDHKDATVGERARKLLAGAVSSDRQKVVDGYRPALKLKGDAERGRAVFKRTCAACHRLGGEGQEVGPDLAALRDKSGEALLIAILDPNQAVEARYISYVATTKNGLSYLGLLASETGNSVTLIGADGKKQTILRSDLEDLVSTGKSTMPEGLEKDLKLNEMGDLLGFIRAATPAPKRKLFEGNRPEVAKVGGDGALRLFAQNCEIYGATLILEKQYGNLGYWSSADDRAVWTVEVPRTGKYAVWLDWACHDDAAGNTFELSAAGKRMTWKVAGTGTWDTYRYRRVGEMELAAGRQQIVAQSAGPVRGSLIDLKSIKLIPGPKK